MSADGDLARLANAHGIMLGYRDMQGTERSASCDTLRALLAAIGVEAGSAADIRAGLAALDADRRRRRFPAERIIACRMPTQLALSAVDRWRLRRDGAEDDVARGGAADRIALPALDPDLYLLDVTSGAARETIRILAAPHRAPGLAGPGSPPRIWGICLALYGLRSPRNGGIGDFADLAAMARVAAEKGANFLGTNPVHAMGHASDETSPYSPSHRGYLNSGHIALDAVPGLAGTPEAGRILDLAGADLAALRASPNVDYRGQRALHRRLLHQLYQVFCKLAPAAARRDLAAFASAGGNDLAEFARYEALAERHGPDWRQWPDPSAMTGEPTRAGYHVWLQWVADHQRADAQRVAREAGMSLGLFQDLAVGARRGGAEDWCERLTVAQGVSVGAPPDQLSPEGQNWNLAGYAPELLAAQNYRPFRRMLAATMRHAGVVRIDHVLGLARSFWLPDDGSPGGYVRQPFDALLAIAKIEAEKHGAVLIGEDLGLVPDGFRKATRKNGFYGYSVMQYERDHDQALRPVAGLPADTLCCFATHDTPTVRGFELGRDIAWWTHLGWLDGAEQSRALAQRRRDVDALNRLTGHQAFAAGVHGLLARAPAAMAAVQLDDILGHEEAQNLPGTTTEHPNWQRKYGVEIATLARDPRLAALAGAMNETRGQSQLRCTEETDNDL